MSSRIKHDDILLLEQPFLKVPTDGIRTSFRSTQRILERDFDKLNSNLKEVSKKFQKQTNSSNNSSANQQDEAVKAIDGLLVKARGLKRKLDETYSNPQTGTEPTLNRIKARLDHLHDLYSSEYCNDPSYKQFSQVRLDRHLVDYMLRVGCTRSAQSLSQVAGIEPLVDENLFSELARIESALNQHSCTEALAWCKENSGALKKMQSTLEFELRYQEFIELAKSKQFGPAISYSRAQLVPWQGTHLKQISQVMTLLAFDKSTTCPPYAKLYDESRWTDLLNSFRTTLFALHAIPEQSLLHLSLSVGLAALKLPACYAKPIETTVTAGADEVEMSTPFTRSTRSSNFLRSASSSSSPSSSMAVSNSNNQSLNPPSNYDPNLVRTNMSTTNPAQAVFEDHQPQSLRQSQRNQDCPVCDENGLGELARECPWSHHLNSIIVCGLTGKVINDGDGLAVLPNGRVYSRDGLEQMAYRDEGRIRCPRTGQIFGMNEILRVYIS
ncbi:CTLH/CRA C-terminal to lish motif domain-containing protein [Phakopsora pachyrhizi]|uniref:CTLH/CRA C-terminal to lish motif domain-domain-containing protein n=1 Tax=Phakopsora pachyrhizi TaxID=170000 RepID=A0AAV0BIJ4_PHAPC|nr:CTLH/CRA C-terminal to lish motif domain-containing protein [Phakopsora pachyrhizi]CAH7686482.1 CTLH/CRA C-terminal to lish motif domain-domain-containing protein [Phakopsora pachyrhizi]